MVLELFWAQFFDRCLTDEMKSVRKASLNIDSPYWVQQRLHQILRVVSEVKRFCTPKKRHSLKHWWGKPEKVILCG